MTSKLTREQVIALITEHSYDSALVDALEYLLAALDSEPVFTLQVSQAGYKGQKLGNHFGFITLDAARELDEGNYQLYRHAQQPVVRPAPECQHQWRHGGANKLQNQKQCIKCGRVELDAQQPVVQDERAAFNAWNNDVDCHLAGRDAKSAAWLAWQARAKLVGNSPVIPDGYVMVPKEPTKEMIDAGWLHYMATKNPSSKGTYKAMLAAAPQEVKGE